MTLDLTFKQVCDLVKKDEPTLLDATDKLLGLALACSPIVLGPNALAVLPVIAVKNEIYKIAADVLKRYTKKTDDDYLGRQMRMQVAYGLVCYTAFFEALDRQLPEKTRKKIKLLNGEKIFLAKSAQDKTTSLSEDASEKALECVSADRITTRQIMFPHPTESLLQQQRRHGELYRLMADGFKEFVQKLAFWEDADEKEQILFIKAIEQVPSVAALCFEEQYFELSRRYEDFAVWANLQEHEKSQNLIASLSDYFRQYADLSINAANTIDIGFDKLHQAVLSIPETIKLEQSNNIVDGFTKHYLARIIEPIIEDRDDIEEGKPRLSFPRVCEAFIPQSFRVLVQQQKTKRLEAEETWKDLPGRDDLNSFLLSYLSSPYSTETPLVVLGHPGSGKSLLTTILAAQLMSNHYTAIKVPLREVNSEAGIVNQIEEYIGRVTSIQLDSWAKLSGAFKNNPPVVILDGYDELLQASGKVFSGYLKDVQTFQKNEAEQGRPVRVIVTSRITLIDKATIPSGSTIVRLLEFDERRRNRWISIWNATNLNYFAESDVNAFELPKENEPDSTKVLSLAGQPLLLLMLALYDSEGNKLVNHDTLDRTMLYHSLLKRFIERERSKDKEFRELRLSEQEKELDKDMERLGVAAIGMYNRRKLHIHSSELNEDLKFFDLERENPDANRTALTQAELLLGSFFFVHKSKAQQTSGAEEQHEEKTAFEFLHNTFGEFLTADFIIRQAMKEIETLIGLRQNTALRSQLEQKLGDADGFARAWFACLVYTPLFTRPVVLEMIREWIGHTLKSKKVKGQMFQAQLETIVLNQITRLLTKRVMPSIMYKESAQEGYRPPFGDHPLLGHIAIYSINLVILRAVISSDPFVFEEAMIASHEDGTRPWDQLMYIWRSWFSLENLNGLTGVMRSDRQLDKVADKDQSRITIRSKDTFRVSDSQNRLETFLNIGISVGDNISSGIAGLLLYNPAYDRLTSGNQMELDDIAQRLSSEDMGLELQIKMKLLQEGATEELVNIALDAFRMAFQTGRYHEVDQIVLSLQRGLNASFNHNPDMLIDRLLDSDLLADLVYRNPLAALRLLKTLLEDGGGGWLRRHGQEFFDFLMRRVMSPELFEQNPETAFGIVLLVSEFGGARWFARHEGKPFRRFLDAIFASDQFERNPTIGLRLLQLSMAGGGILGSERLGGELLVRMLRWVTKSGLLDQRSEYIFGLLHLLKHPAARSLFARHGEILYDHLLNYIDPREIAGFHPETAIGLLLLGLEVGDQLRYRHYRDELFHQVFQIQNLEWLLVNRPEGFTQGLRLARTSEIQEAAEMLSQTIGSYLNDQPRARNGLLRRLPMEALPDLLWLAKKTRDEQLTTALRQILGDSGDEYVIIGV